MKRGLLILVCLAVCGCSTARRSVSQAAGERVFFGRTFEGPGLYLPLGGVITVRDVDDAVSVQVWVVNGYDRDVFFRTPDDDNQPFPFGKPGEGKVTYFDAKGEQILVGQPFVGFRGSSHYRPKYELLPSAVTSEGVLAVSSQTIMVLEYESSCTSVLVDGAELEEMPQATSRIEIVVPFQLEYRILGETNQFRDTIDLKIVAFRTPKEG